MKEFSTRPAGQAFEGDVHTKRHPAKVMIVEDEAIIAWDIQRSLLTAGFAVTGKAESEAAAYGN